MVVVVAERAKRRLVNLRARAILLLGCAAFVHVSLAAEQAETEQVEAEQVQPLSPQESLKTMTVQDGYVMELVAAEPIVEEPVLLAYDGNGRMYVAEMLTYMLDVDGSGQLVPTSRIKRLSDTDGDGVMDAFTIFADNLLLPRMIQPVGDGQILVRETNTLDLLLISDTDADGVADTRQVVYQGGPRGGNLEHQPSGLMYNIDNWMYVTYTDKRYKFDGETIMADSIPIGLGQWGLAQDATGRIFYSTAGGEDPAFNFQFPSVYGKIEVAGEKAEGFNEVFPLSTIPDVQGGPMRLRENNSLNHFTGGGGQSIYLTDSLTDLAGDYFIPEPVGNLIRRAKVTRAHGYSVVSNPYQSAQKEFVASTDPSFRPIWTETAPDGSLMVVDMYRGIIQESEWTPEGSYLREVIEEYGLDKIIGRGRIYRITQPGIELGPQPRMYSETPAQLLAHLEHPSFWWRINAQKNIVLARDKRVIPALKAMATSHKNPYARLHALWSLEGLGELDSALLVAKFDDANLDVRLAAIRISEQLIDSNRSLIVKQWVRLAEELGNNDAGIEIAQQLWLSVNFTGLDEPELAIIKAAVHKTHAKAPAFVAINSRIDKLRLERESMARLASTNVALFEAAVRGKKHYETHCFSCHGLNGEGAAMTADDLMAPSFQHNPRVTGNLSVLGRIVLSGLAGPIEGKTYGAMIMAPLSSNDDQYIADVLSYIRNDFGNQASLISADQIAQLRLIESDRKASDGAEYWTVDALEQRFSQPLNNKAEWIVSASHGSPEDLSNAIDGVKNVEQRWTSKITQQPGIWFQIELPELTAVSEIHLMTTYPTRDYARGYTVEFSEDGSYWTTVDENLQQQAPPDGVSINDRMLMPTRFIRLTLTGHDESRWWSINEIDIYGSALSR